MKLLKSLILTLIITIAFTTSLIFGQDTVKQDNIKLVPSGEVVGLSLCIPNIKRKCKRFRIW